MFRRSGQLDTLFPVPSQDSERPAGFYSPDSTQPACLRGPDSTQPAGLRSPDSTQPAGLCSPDSTQPTGLCSPDSTQPAGLRSPDSTQSAGLCSTAHSSGPRRLCGPPDFVRSAALSGPSCSEKDTTSARREDTLLSAATEHQETAFPAVAPRADTTSRATRPADTAFSVPLARDDPLLACMTSHREEDSTRSTMAGDDDDIWMSGRTRSVGQHRPASVSDLVIYGYHGYRVSTDAAGPNMPLLRDMSYEELPKTSSLGCLPDVCDLGGVPLDGGRFQSPIQAAQYGGSFTVAGTDQATRSEYVRNTIHRLQVPTSGTKPVLLAVSLHGIKVCSPERKEIYMSHALRRISYATCDPARSQFSFLAREPRGHLNLQYCHTFFTSSPHKAEELNAVVGNAFRLAYAARLQRSCRGQPTGESASCCTTESHPTADKANNRTWGRRSRQREPGRRELCRGKSVNVASGSSEPETTARLAPELRRSLLTGYVNEAVSVTDSESRSSESDGRPLSAAGRSVSESSQSLRDDAKSCHWSSASSSASTSHVDGVSGASTPTPPPYYQQGPSDESLQLRTAAWFQAGIPREIALEVLSQEPVGAFMVRESTTKHGCYALSLRVPRDFQVSGIAHYLILNTTKGYKIKGFTKEFTSLTALITHHSVMPELLPCTLSLSRYNPDFARVESSDLVELDADSEYNGLSQLSQATSDTSV